MFHLGPHGAELYYIKNCSQRNGKERKQKAHHNFRTNSFLWDKILRKTQETAREHRYHYEISDRENKQVQFISPLQLYAKQAHRGPGEVFCVCDVSFSATGIVTQIWMMAHY